MPNFPQVVTVRYRRNANYKFSLTELRPIPQARYLATPSSPYRHAPNTPPRGPSPPHSSQVDQHKSHSALVFFIALTKWRACVKEGEHDLRRIFTIISAMTYYFKIFLHQPGDRRLQKIFFRWL